VMKRNLRLMTSFLVLAGASIGFTGCSSEASSNSTLPEGHYEVDGHDHSDHDGHDHDEHGDHDHEGHDHE